MGTTASDPVQPHRMRSALADIGKTFFTFEGRLNRRRYWLLSVGATASVFAFLWAAAYILTWSAYWTLLALCLGSFAWAMFALAAKRLHDRNYSGWILLGFFVPYLDIAFFVWFAYQACRAGSPAQNHYGAAPLSAGKSSPVVGFFVSSFTRFGRWIEQLAKNREPREPNPTVIKEVRTRSGGTLLLVILVGVGGYILALDWSRAHHQTLDNPGDYVNAMVSAIQDKQYIHELGDKLQKWWQAHAS